MPYVGTAPLSPDELTLLLTLPMMQIMPHEAGEMLRLLNDAGARPFTMFAFATVGIIVTEDNLHRHKPEDLERWEDARRIYHACNGEIPRAVEAYKHWLNSELN